MSSLTKASKILVYSYLHNLQKAERPLLEHGNITIKCCFYCYNWYKYGFIKRDILFYTALKLIARDSSRT